MHETRTKVFLRAGWYDLIMANYAVDATILQPFLPLHTEVDLWDGKCYVSLVGFKFTDTKVLGIKFPFHTDFEEVNLRFYVRSKDDKGQWKRGVVFVKEIVPRTMIAFIANRLYGEKYLALPMKHECKEQEHSKEVMYAWKFGNSWNEIKVLAARETAPMEKGSAEEFIAEHYWGYTRLSEFLTMEYEVEHPSWNIHKVMSYSINCDFEKLYGASFKELNFRAPDSIFMADGSDIVVRAGKKKGIE